MNNGDIDLYPSIDSDAIMGVSTPGGSTPSHPHVGGNSDPGRDLKSAHDPIVDVIAGVKFFDHEQYQCHPLITQFLLAISAGALEAAANIFGDSCDLILTFVPQVGMRFPSSFSEQGTDKREKLRVDTAPVLAVLRNLRAATVTTTHNQHSLHTACASCE